MIGSKFNGDGNFVNWWTEEDRKNFDDRVQCIKDQFKVDKMIFNQ